MQNYYRIYLDMQENTLKKEISSSRLHCLGVEIIQVEPNLALEISGCPLMTMNDAKAETVIGGHCRAPRAGSALGPRLYFCKISKPHLQIHVVH